MYDFTFCISGNSSRSRTLRWICCQILGVYTNHACFYIVRRLQELCMPLPYLHYDQRWSYLWSVKVNSQVDLLYK